MIFDFLLTLCCMLTFFIMFFGWPPTLLEAIYLIGVYVIASGLLVALDNTNNQNH